MFIFSRTTNGEQQPRRRMGCLSGCLVFFLIYFACSAILGWIMGDAFATSKVVTLENNTIYRLKMDGVLVEQGQEEDPFSSFYGELPGMGGTTSTVGLDQILSNIRLAKNDDRILGIWLDGASMSMGSASAKAIRDALLDFKQSGKWIIASAKQYGQTNYYVASVADRICLDPTGSVSWNGLAAQKMYYTRLFEKIGVEMQIIKVGTFKSAVEPYFRTSMSPEDRMQTMQYVNGIWDEYKAEVSKARNIPVDQLNALADQYMGLQSAQAQLQAGLVDTIVYTQDMDSLLRVYGGTKEYKTLTTAKLAQVKRTESLATDEIAVLYLDGAITDETGDGIVGKEVVKTIKQIRKNDNIKALVLRVNSPGGSADASEQIWHAIENVKADSIPVVVSMGDYAASGGYYISCGADYIYAEPTTITGSIGIFGTIPSIVKLREKIGLDIDGITTNKHSGLESNIPYKTMTAEETQLMQNMVERGYELFTTRCADGRGVSQEYIKSVGEGRVWLGTKAKELQLVDEIGNIDDAIAKAVELAALESYKLTYYPEVKDPIEELLKKLDNTTPEEQLVNKIREFAAQPRVMALTPEVIIQ
ncbi:MAG: signal peptide peptidase SppA [Paludibacteraceae bacterium]|nr:signal peptide peptidase SppA [Paludibacteraceae bacterium]